MAEQAKRGRMSRIRRLPADLRDLIDRLLADGLPQTEIIEQLQPLLEARGERPLSPPALSRYATRMESVAKRFRESREIARVWCQEIGGRPDTEFGQAMIHLIQTLAFEVSHKLATEEHTPEDLVTTLKDLSLLAQRLGSAMASTQRAEGEIRKQIAAEAETEATKLGISEDTALAIRAAIEGEAA